MATRAQQIAEAAHAYDLRYCNNPCLWAKEKLKVDLWSKQKEILDSVFRNPKTVVRASYSVGKTFVAAVAVLAFINLRIPCKIVTTAPTWRQVKDLLWSEINHLYITRLQPRRPKGRMLLTRYDVEPDWFAEGISPREAVNFQGYHQRHVLVVLDECPGVRSEIVDGSDSLLASGDAHALWIGNPLDAEGHFYEAFRDPTIPDKAKFRISAFDTPNFTNEDCPQYVKNKLVSRAWVEGRREKWGEGSPLWLSRVEAEFSETQSVNQLIPLSLCDAAKNREIEPEGRKEMGIDVARFGDDRSVLTVRQGLVIIDIQSVSKWDTMAVTGRGIAMDREHGGMDSIKVDVVGLGAGVVDRLNELNYPVIGVNSGERAFDPEQYFNRRTEMWFEMRDWLHMGRIPPNDDLIADLTAPRFGYTSKGQYQLEKKEQTKKRLKGRSPDYGDSGVLATQDARRLEPEVYATSTHKTAADLGIR